MKRWTIRTKLFISFGTLILLALLIGGVGHFEIVNITHQEHIGELANRILVNAQEARAYALRYAIYGEQRYFDGVTAEFENVLSRVDEAQSLMRDGENQENTASLAAAAQRYQGDTIEYYNVRQQILESGAIRVERAQLMLAELIDVIDAARSFAYTTQISVGGQTYLERSSVERVWLVQEARNATNRFRILAQTYQLTTDAAEQERIAGEWNAEIVTVRSLLTEGLGLMRSAVTRGAIDEALGALDEYEAQALEFIANTQTLREIETRQETNANRVIADARSMRDTTAAAVMEVTEQADTVLLVLLAISVAIAVLLALTITRSIIRSLGCEPREIEAITSRIAQGDLTGNFDKKTVEGAYASMREMSDKLSSLIGTIKGGTDKLNEVGSDLASSAEETSAALGQVTDNVASIDQQLKTQRDSVEEVTAAVAQISSNIESLNNAVTNQSSQVVESSSAVEQMVSSINRVAANMANVYQATEDLRRSGEDGLAKMNRSNERIKQVAEQSKRLLDTNRLISDIANKTNLLAMNASIEAAHAGDSGRGFSVVADEIRKLAESTGTQSREVSEMIKMIQSLISEIVVDADETTSSIKTISEMVTGVNERSAEVREAMLEQSSGSQQLLESLSQMTQITQAVQDGSDEINNGSTLVLSETIRLKDTIDQNSARVSDIASSIVQINRAVQDVMSISGTNKEMVGGIVGEMTFFRTTGAGSLVTLNTEDQEQQSA